MRNSYTDDDIKIKSYSIYDLHILTEVIRNRLTKPKIRHFINRIFKRIQYDTMEKVPIKVSMVAPGTVSYFFTTTKKMFWVRIMLWCWNLSLGFSYQHLRIKGIKRVKTSMLDNSLWNVWIKLQLYYKVRYHQGKAWIENVSIYSKHAGILGKRDKKQAAF